MKKQSANSLLLLVLIGLIVASALKAVTTPPFIMATVGLTLITCIYRAYKLGVYREFFTLLRFAGSLTLGWYLSAYVGTALGLPALLSAISGFYLTFISVFLLSGVMLKWFSPEKDEVSIPAKLLGGMLGGFEGIIVSWLLVFTMTMLPDSKIADYYPQFSQFTGPVENMLAPVLPEEAAQTVQMVKSVQRISRNFNPEKVDRAALQEILMPLAEMPELVALQQDESIRDLVEKKDFKALLNHPTLRNLLESEELRTRMQNIDLRKLERALVPHLNQQSDDIGVQ